MALIVSSPLRRALQTSVHAFAPALQRDGVKVLLQPMAQEMNAYACDIGTDREKLERQVGAGELWDEGLSVPSEKVDFSLVEDGWNSKVFLFAALDVRMLMRCRRANGHQTEQQSRNVPQSCARGSSTVKKRLWLSSRMEGFCMR